MNIKSLLIVGIFSLATASHALAVPTGTKGKFTTSSVVLACTSDALLKRLLNLAVVRDDIAIKKLISTSIDSKQCVFIEKDSIVYLNVVGFFGKIRQEGDPNSYLFIADHITIK